MVSFLWAVFVLEAVVLAACFVPGKLWAQLADEGGDTGEPLFLTPYIESGNINEARRLARVMPLYYNWGIESYAGYFTVNKTYDSNQFFWFFPSMSGDQGNDPVIVWLQGGPGTPTVLSIFGENGPFVIWNGMIQRNMYHWTQNHHMIYIDNPVGTGFSFTRHPQGYRTDQTQIGEDLYSSVTQFFKLFPELQQNKFFVGGTSYAGKYVPALGYTIHKKNPAAETKINLKGLAIGNGWTDPEHQCKYSEYLYQIGLIDSNQRKVFEDYEAKSLEHIKNGQWDEATDTLMELIAQGPNSYFANETGFNMYYNYLMSGNGNVDVTFLTLIQSLNQTWFKKLVHVGNLPFFVNNPEVWMHLKQDISKSVAPWMSELLEHYYCCIFTGQLDIIVPYSLTVNYLQHLNFSGSEEYKTAKRQLWRVNGELAGYTKQGGKLIEVLIRNAGYYAASDQPAWVFDMINRFTHSAK